MSKQDEALKLAAAIEGAMKNSLPGRYVSHTEVSDALLRRVVSALRECASPPARSCPQVSDGVLCGVPRREGERVCPDCNPQPEAQPAVAAGDECVTVLGVRSDGSSEVVGTAPLPASMKRRELVREMFGESSADESGTDWDYYHKNQPLAWEAARAALAAPVPAQAREQIDARKEFEAWAKQADDSNIAAQEHGSDGESWWWFSEDCWRAWKAAVLAADRPALTQAQHDEIQAALPKMDERESVTCGITGSTLRALYNAARGILDDRSAKT